MRNEKITLWSKRNNPSGGMIWKAERNVTVETANDWMKIFQADEPNVLFLCSIRKPKL